MANLQTQITALAGSTTNALQWANDGIKAVVDRVSSIDPDSRSLFASSVSADQNLGSVTNINANGGTISSSGNTVRIVHTGYKQDGTTATTVKVHIKSGSNIIAKLDANEEITLEEIGSTLTFATADNTEVGVDWHTVSGTAYVSIADGDHVISVSRGNKIAIEIPPEKRFAANEATSLQKATVDYPQFYKLNQKLYVLPTPTSSAQLSVSKTGYTTLTALTGTTIANFPATLVPVVVSYTAMKSLNEKMVGYTGLSGLVLSLPSVPPLPALAFSVTDTLSSIDKTEITNVALPVYESVADPNITAIDLSSLGSPVLPTSPSFVYEDAQLQKFFSDLTVGFSTSAPSYTPPPMKEINFSKITSLIETDEDIELAQAKLSEEQTKVQEYSAKVQDSMNTFNKENAEYQVQYQKAVQEFESNVNRRMQEMQISSNLELQNKAKSLEKDVSEYSSTLQRFTQDLQKYQSDINKEVQEWTLNNLNVTFTKWQSDLQHSINEYQARVGTTLQKYSSDIGKMGAITQTEANKLGANLQKDSAKNGIELQKFSSALQKYTQNAQTLIAEFNVKMQKSQIEYQWYEKQFALAQQQYEKGFEPFMIRRQLYGKQN